MALPSQIEIQCGGDRRLLTGLWLVWLAALLSTLAYAQLMPLALQLISFTLLIASLPRASSRSMKPQHLRLHASGSLSCGELRGRWSSNTWRNPWYTVIRIQTGKQQWWAWISVSRNPPDAWRRLGIWCRYSPQQSPGMAGFDHSS